MMSPEQNELMTRVGPGTKCGALMRHYWHPVALADELPAERPAKPVRVLGQDFVLFRDERGRHGLLDRDCPHRGAEFGQRRRVDQLHRERERYTEHHRKQRRRVAPGMVAEFGPGEGLQEAEHRRRLQCVRQATRLRSHSRSFACCARSDALSRQRPGLARGAAP